MTKKTNIKTPNIFDYATSELSQDAFFAWLLEWAEDGYKETYPELHKCALGLLKAFFNEYYKEFHRSLGVSFGCLKDIQNFSSVREIKSVEVNRQVKRIDLWLTIETDNGNYYVVIEDKIGAKPGKNQLKAYRDLVINDCDKKRKSCFIYLKTGELNQSEIDKVKNEKYSLFDLNSVYKKLENCNSESEIFQGYFFKLEAEYFFRSFKENEENDLDALFGKRGGYQHGVWKNNCYYFYYKKNKLSCKKYPEYFLALDVWLEKKNELNFYFHIISDPNGCWIEDLDMRNIDEIKNICEKNKGYDYEEKDNDYKRTYTFTDQADLNKIIKTEIKKLFYDK